MSSAALETETPAPPKPLPVGVSNLLTFWWLTIAFAIVAAWMFWGNMPPPVTSAAGPDAMERTETGFGKGLFWLVLLGLLGLGSLAAYSIVTHRRIGLLLLKVGAIVGMLLGVVFFVLAGLTIKGGFGGIFEPQPMFVGALLSMVVLLPLVFGMMPLMTLGGADDIQEYFAAAGPAVAEGGTGQYVVPAAFAGTAAAGAGAAVAAETLAYRDEPEAAEAPFRSTAPAEEAAFDAAVEDAVAEAPVEEAEEAEITHPENLATRHVSEEEMAQSAEMARLSESPPAAPAEGEVAEFTPAAPEAEEGEIFEFEMSPEEEQENPPPEEPGRQTLR